MLQNPPWRISVLADFRPMGLNHSFHAMVVFGLGKNHLLFKSSLGNCGPALLKDVQFDPCTSN